MPDPLFQGHLLSLLTDAYTHSTEPDLHSLRADSDGSEVELLMGKVSDKHTHTLHVLPCINTQCALVVHTRTHTHAHTHKHTHAQTHKHSCVFQSAPPHQLHVVLEPALLHPLRP
jgi:hypothetical protein